MASWTYEEATGTPSSSPPVTITPAPAKSWTYDEAVGNDASGSGNLSNSPDDGLVSGALKGTATGVIKGLSNTVGTVGNLSNLADFLVAGGEHLVTGKPVADIQADIKSQRAAQESQSGLNKIDPRAVLPNGADVAAPILAKTGEYTPTSGVGRMAQAGVEAVAGSVGPGVGSAAAPLKSILSGAAKMAPANFTSGAAAQGVTDATNNPWLGLAAGIAAPAVAEGLGKVATPVTAPLGTMVMRKADSVPNWLGGQKLRDANDARLGSTMLGMAADPAAVQDTLNPQESSANTSSVAVPGFKPTTAQLTGDLGLLQSERQMNVADNTPFKTREEQQNAAAQAGLQSPFANADAMLPSEAFRNHLDMIEQASQAATDHFTNEAQKAQAANIGTGGTPEDIGASIRQKIAAKDEMVNSLRRQAYSLVPDEFEATVQPIKQAVAQIQKDADPRVTQFDPVESRFYDMAKKLPPTLPYKSLMTFDKELNAALPKLDGPAKFRLQQLKNTVMGTLDGSLDGQHNRDMEAVMSGQMAPEDALGHRIYDHVDAFNSDISSRAEGSDLGGGTATGNTSAVAPPVRGAEGQAEERLSTPAGDSGVSQAPLFDPSEVTQRPKAPPMPRPRTLEDFIRDNGGMQDPGGDLKSMGYDNVRGFIAKDGKGMTPDRMREAAAEAGYLGADTEHAVANTDVNDLYNHLGSNVHSVRDEDAVQAWAEYDANRAEYDKMRGPKSASARPPQAPLSAYRNEDIYPAGLEPSNPSTNPARAAEASDALRDAKLVHAYYARNLKSGPLGSVMDTNGYKGQYTVQNGGVAQRAVVAGDKGYDTAKAFLRTVPTDAERSALEKLDPNFDPKLGTVEDLKDHTLNQLRSMPLSPAGTVTKKSYDTWRSKYAGTLRAIEEVSPGFSKQVSTPAEATARMTEAGEAQAARIDEFQKSVAGKLIGATEPTEAQTQVGKLLADKTAGPTKIKALMAQVNDLPKDQRADVVAGLQKLGAASLAQRFTNATKEGTSDTRILSTTRLAKEVDDQRPALEALFGKDKIKQIDAIAHVLDQKQFSVSATSIKGSPGTAKDTYASLAKIADKHAGHGAGATVMALAVDRFLEHGMEAITSLLSPHAAAALGGAGLVIGLKKIKNANAKADQTVINDALMNPERFAHYISKVGSKKEADGRLNALSASIRRQLINQPIIQGR